VQAWTPRRLPPIAMLPAPAGSGFGAPSTGR
jgi:hypothetical protein